MMLFRIWRLNHTHIHTHTHTHTHEHSDVQVLTHHRSTLIHYRKHYTNSAIDSVVQQPTKYIHSYFAVLCWKSLHTTTAVWAWDCVNNSYCETNRVRAVPGRTRAKPAGQLAGQLQQPGNERDMWHSSALRGGAPHEAGRGLPRTYRTLVTICTTSFIHSVFCLTTGSKPPSKRFLHIVRSRASSFKWQYPLLSLRSLSSFLCLLPRLLVTSISPFVFPSITFLEGSFYVRCDQSS